MLKYFSLPIILFFFSPICFGEVFIVSNPADSGVGTLREALTLAANNGVVETDYIKFDLPGSSIGEKTIIVESSLPQLSSNLVIDASTQPGNFIGLSHAKVVIKTLLSTTAIVLFKGESVERVEFYGIYFLDTSNPNLSQPNAAEKCALRITKSKNIVIGDENKGNVFNGYNIRIIDFSDIQGLKIADNLFGQSPYVLDLVGTGYIQLTDVDFLDIGGNEKRNTFFAHCAILYKDKVKDFEVAIRNNNFGVFSDGITTSHSVDETFLAITGDRGGFNPLDGKVKLVFEDNLLSHYGSGIKLAYLAGNIKIRHNWFGTDRANNLPLNLRKAHGGTGTAVLLESVNAEVIVGDEDPAFGNIIAYSFGGVSINNSLKVKVIRNSFKCVEKEISYVDGPQYPVVTVTQNTASFIKGLSTPNAVVDVYVSDDCINCSPEIFIGSVQSSATGEWQYDFTKTYTRSILANAHFGKNSSRFTKPIINSSRVQITNTGCGNAGLIKGIEISNTDKLRWVDKNGITVSTEKELTNVPAGDYKLIIGQYCTVESAYFRINDITPIISNSTAVLNKPDCGQANGSIAIFAYSPVGSPLTYKWVNQANEIIATTRNISRLPAGIYILTVSTGTCNATSLPIALNADKAPIILTDKLIIKEASCGNTDGSIEKVEVVGIGVVKYEWKNEFSQTVGNKSDLKDVPGGKYTLAITDDSGCGPIYSQQFIVSETNGIDIDLTKLVIKPSLAGRPTGSIEGIQTTGAIRYKWYNSSNALVGELLALSQVSAGIYYLEASNDFCAKKTDPITINTLVFTGDYPSTKILIDASCNLANGSIEVIFREDEPSGFRWEDENSQTVGRNRKLENIEAGTYQSFYTDNNGIEAKALAYKISKIPMLSIDVTDIRPDECETGLGSIGGIKIDGGVPPYQINWVDAGGKVLFQAIAKREKLKAGEYFLQVIDSKNCSVLKTVKVMNIDAVISAPETHDLTFCSGGSVTFAVSKAEDSSNYSLFKNKYDAQPIAIANNGIFSLTVTETSSYYMSKLVGICESERVPLQINIGVPKLEIYNTFSPNGDGVNDIWIVKGLENYTDISVQVFNRDGQRLFNSNNGFNGFDGTYKDKPLPIGSYYYIIKFNDTCKPLTGSLMLIR